MARVSSFWGLNRIELLWSFHLTLVIYDLLYCYVEIVIPVVWANCISSIDSCEVFMANFLIRVERLKLTCI